MDTEGEVGVVDSEDNDVEDNVKVGGKVGGVVGWARDGW